jgi:hypothetical protein
MQPNTYKYDVALSFLHRDVMMATQLHDKIADRFKTFLFTKKQDDIAGTDGMDSYSNVFQNEARLNVVLHREGWGDTKWTKIEKNAIKTRIFNEERGEGWNSLLIIKLDKSKLPSWVVDYYVYLDFENFGFEEIAGAIISSAQKLGAVISHENVIDFAKRQGTAITLKKEKDIYLASVKAVEDATVEIANLFKDVSEKWKTIKEDRPELRFGTLKYQEFEYIEFASNGFFLVFNWCHRTTNSLHDSHLQVRIYNETRFTEHRYNEVAKTIYKFSLNNLKEFIWEENEEKFLTSGNLVDYWIKKLITIAHNPPKGNSDAIIESW